MSLRDLNNDHFNSKEEEQIKKGRDLIMEVLNAKSRILTGDDRQRFGSIAEQNKLGVIKSMDYHRSQPHLDCPEVDYDEMIADWKDRTIRADLLSFMAEATIISNNLRIMHDYDAYKSCGDDYQYAKYKKNKAHGAGWEAKYNDLKPFFTMNTGNTLDEEEKIEPTTT